MQRRTRTLLSTAVAVAATIGAGALPSSRKTVTRAIDSRGFMHGFRQVSEADAERIAAAQAKRERKAKKRAASQPQGESK